MHQAAGLPIPSLLSHVLLPLPRASVCVCGGAAGGSGGGGVRQRQRKRQRQEREKQQWPKQVLIFFFSRATSRLVKRLGPKERH